MHPLQAATLVHQHRSDREAEARRYRRAQRPTSADGTAAVAAPRRRLARRGRRLLGPAAA